MLFSIIFEKLGNSLFFSGRDQWEGDLHENREKFQIPGGRLNMEIPEHQQVVK